MRPILVVVLALVWAAPAAAGPVTAQEVELQELRLRDGSVLYGTVVDSAAERIRFRTTRGVEMEIARAEIASMESARGEIVEGEFRRGDPNATRLLFAPTGRALKRGDGYIGVYEIYFPFVQVGITDRISIGGGTPLIFGLDEGDRPFWVTPKVQVLDRARLKAAVGAIHMQLPGGGFRRDWLRRRHSRQSGPSGHVRRRSWVSSR